jgi:hypothetical protein
MDQSTQQVQELEKLLQASRDILITLSATPKIDHVCAMLALSRAIMQMPLTSMSAPGQSRKIIRGVSGRQGSQFSLLPDHEMIYSEIGLRDFVIALPSYVDKSVDSVSWYVDQGKLNVVLKANAAVPMQFDPKQFDPFYAGANFDVVCVIGADNPTEMGALYRQDPGMFTELPVVAIGKNSQHSRFGRVNIVDSSVSSVSELIYEVLVAFNVVVEGDIARLLLCGIEDGSELLQQASARTQEIVQHLRGVVSSPIDVNAVRAQYTGMPLPVHPAGVVTQPTSPAQGPGYQPYPQPPQQMPMPQMNYPQNQNYTGYGPNANPAAGYSGFPAGGYTPNNPGQMYPPQAQYGYPGQLPNVPGQAGYAAPTPQYNQANPNAFSAYHAPMGGPQWPNQEPPAGNQQQGYYPDPQNREGSGRG